MLCLYHTGDKYYGGVENDYQAGARLACSAISGLHLPTIEEFQAISTVKTEYPSLPSEGEFWTSDELSDSPQYYGWRIHLSDGGINDDDKTIQYQVLCVGN